VIESDLKIGVLSRRAPIRKTNDSGVVIEHIGGLTRVIPAIAQLARVAWTTLPTDSQVGLPKQFSLSTLPDQELWHDIKISFAEVNNDELNKSDWFCNHYIWPLLHDLPIPNPDQTDLAPYFTAMDSIGRDLAMQSIDRTISGYLVNDFQLSRVPNALKKSGHEAAVTFFLHTPWPKITRQNAYATRILEFLATGMLSADVIQFQTQNDLQAFENFVLQHFPTRLKATALEVNPVSVNVQGLQDAAKSDLNHMDLCEEDISYVHIARTDPIKNTLPTILAFTEFVKELEKSTPNNYLDLYLVPSRQQWPDYQLLLSEIVACVELCNLELAALNYNPIRLHLGNDYLRASRALVRYDYLLACSVADGLNLVVKEGAILNDRNGVIVSSPYVGAMAEIGKNCVLVDGADQASISIALEKAANLTVESRSNMSKQLKLQVSEFNVNRWAKSIVASLKILEKV